MLYIKNVKTGVSDTVPDHYLDHPILGKDLVLDKTQAAPKNETTKEQPAPEAEPVVAEPETTK
jgi:hypothetical protein